MPHINWWGYFILSIYIFNVLTLVLDSSERSIMNVFDKGTLSLLCNIHFLWLILWAGRHGVVMDVSMTSWRLLQTGDYKGRRRHDVTPFPHFYLLFMSEMDISLDPVVRFRWNKRLYPLFRTWRFQWYPYLWATLRLSVLNKAPKSALQKSEKGSINQPLQQ